MLKFNCFDDAYIHFLSSLFYSPEFYNSPRNSGNREQLNVNFRIENIRDRACRFASRKSNIIFNFAEALWYLSGSNSLEFIEYYCKNMRKYSKDNSTLTGCAYGPKIFKFGKEKINQWQRVIKLLQEDDPLSNRAIIQIFDPREKLDSSNIDVTCTIGLQIFLRKKRLYLAANMRSNDCFRGMVSDIFSFTFIQEFLSAELKVELGAFFHNVGTLHIYESDCKQVLKIIHEAENKKKKRNVPAPLKIPMGNNWAHIRILLEIEESLRKNKIKLSESLIKEAGLPYYWEQILLLLGVYRDMVYEGSFNPIFLDKIHPYYLHLIENKWDKKSVYTH